MLCHVFEDSQTTETLLQMNSNISVIKKTNKQTEIYTLRLSSKTQLKD